MPSPGTGPASISMDIQLVILVPALYIEGWIAETPLLPFGLFRVPRIKGAVLLVWNITYFLTVCNILGIDLAVFISFSSFADQRHSPKIYVSHIYAGRGLVSIRPISYQIHRI